MARLRWLSHPMGGPGDRETLAPRTPMRKPDWAAFGAVLAIAAFTLFYKLSTPAIYWADEARIAINAVEMMHSRNPLIVTFHGRPDLWNTKPPLATWLSALSMRAFGMNELALRLPAALASLATVVSVFFFTRRISRSAATGALASLALLGTGGFVEIHVSRTADFDSLLVLFTALTSFFLFEAIERPSRKMIWLTALAFACGLFTKGPAGLLMIPGYALYLALTGKLKAALSCRTAWLALFAVVASAAAYLLARELFAPGYLQASFMEDVTRFGVPADNHWGRWWFYAARLILPWQPQIHFRSLGEIIYIQSAFPWSALALLGVTNLRCARTPADRAYAFLFCSTACFLVMISAAATKLPWYVAPSYPLIAVLAALGVRRFADMLSDDWPKGQRMLMPAAIGLGVFSIGLNLLKIEDQVENPNRFVDSRLPNFLKSQSFADYSRLRIVRQLPWRTPAVTNGRIAGMEPYYGPAEFYVRQHPGARVVEPGYRPLPGEMLAGCGGPIRPYLGLQILVRRETCYVVRKS